jgi:hypothetical protein
MQCGRGESETQREFEFVFTVNALDAGVQLNQIGLVMLQKLFELGCGSLGDQFDRLVPFDILVAD